MKRENVEVEVEVLGVEVGGGIWMDSTVRARMRGPSKPWEEGC